jgi:hypothetical protein
LLQSSRMTRAVRSRGRMDLMLLAAICAFSFGMIVKVALADSYHVTCVGHGFVTGGSVNDGSFFSRVEPGCSAVYRYCGLKVSGSTVGSQEAYGNSGNCNAAGRDFGDFNECLAAADVYDQGVFSEHNHPNGC